MQYLARKRDLNVPGNTDDWLATKKGVSEHTCKVHYTVDHLRRRGSDYRMNDYQTPEWVRRSRPA